MSSYLHAELSEVIIKAFYRVYNTLGYGFLEKVYENSLLIELRKAGLTAEAQRPIKVYYDKVEVGFYIADIIIDEKIIVELKAAESLQEEHEAQLLNYLRATNIEVGLLMNFGKKAEVKRKVFSNSYKK